MLCEGEIQAWFAWLDVAATELEAFRVTLAPDEIARAARFLYDRDRNRYIAARGMLRILLGRYIAVRPEALSFTYGKHGKPALEKPASDVRFNVSHSDSLALFAFTLRREIGCDVEQLRDDVLRDGIAERFFSPGETAALKALSPEQRNLGFFNCWTRKEAWIKARSEGLSIPLDSFDVSLAPGDAAALLKTRPDSAEAARWSIQAPEAPAGFTAAVAVEGSPCRLLLNVWSASYRIQTFASTDMPGRSR